MASQIIQALIRTKLTGIVALYPTNALTKEDGRYFVKGEFTNKLPDDVGGAGVYTCLTNSLGAAGFYVERFRGNDDLAGMTERRFKAAGQLTDLMIGWSQIELGRESGYEQLHEFLDVNVRRDLKNLSSYWWGRAGQQLQNQCERGIHGSLWTIPVRTRLFHTRRNPQPVKR